ncbi:WD40 repeat-like protein [Xylona heveae TC161]|uniref:WD40 repeat-like protein n=1 Tax=Xylona heveae (strain CBS 132557 / TC161) TaxID=1328760 RepID=A0A161TFN8_XYLHT|nr:WD40 repeat-like protein [Xylona heveae TC161]KZF24867.1 WD40 repeat-like protein [Xylona heveae TC161]
MTNISNIPVGPMPGPSTGFSNSQPQFAAAAPSSSSSSSSYPSTSMQVSFRLDEGYSEETRSQTGSEFAVGGDMKAGVMAGQAPAPSVPLPAWVLALNEVDRTELAYAVVRSLHTSSIAAIVQRLDPLLHLDPVTYLPPELTSEIFSYLDPSTLLKASTASRAWRARTMDSSLWRQLYGSEGWGVDVPQIRNFEREYLYPNGPPGRETRTRPADADVDQQAHKRVRVRPRNPPTAPVEGGLFGRGPRSPLQTSYGDDRVDDGPQGWNDQHGTIEVDEQISPEAGSSSTDARMTEDSQDGDFALSAHTSQSSQTPTPTAMDAMLSHTSSNAMDEDMYPSPLLSAQEVATTTHNYAADLLTAPSLLIHPAFGAPRVNWHYLYKQRRRLEDNWDAGRYTNFQLPHPDHPHEAHRECVYTIQYSGNFLVSGSRDRTVRIWDLESRRLLRKPLAGHTGSVLCLQFDERGDQDIIISGSSDTDVILWRFSTGEMIRKIERAHRESVLNLRFDDRYLITCSKDKTIKVWSRRELLPGDTDYPRITGAGSAVFPSYIISPVTHPYLYTNGQLNKKVKPLPPYSLLMTLHGHNAAVNAIQVYDDQIVSASGDRLIKVWDIRTGECLKTLPGHRKGIACLQFDGRRIVSGSSDNTVRIFDRSSGVEVACLEAHGNLVRTVQAGFGDLPGDEDDLQAEARAIDQSFFAARAAGSVPDAAETGRLRRRNAGSRNPRDILGYGAKLPPGGGGTRWSRIVSGSYDETVIVWRRDAEGKWVVGSRLRQEDAVLAAGGSRRAIPQDRFTVPQHEMAQQLTLLHHDAHAQHHHPPNPSVQHTPGSFPHIAHAQAAATATALAAQGFHSVATSMQANWPQITNGNQNSNPPSNPATGPGGVSVTAAAQSSAQHAQQGIGANAGPAQHGGTITTAAAHPPPVQNQTPHLHPPPFPNLPQGHLPANHPLNHHHHHHHHLHPAAVDAPNGASQSNSRVFKLQFDARRIICCSQDPRIIGWDFANGDESVIEASRFFTGP